MYLPREPGLLDYPHLQRLSHHEPLILTLWLLHSALATELLPRQPALDTDERLHPLLSWLAQQGIAAEPATCRRAVYSGRPVEAASTRGRSN